MARKRTGPEHDITKEGSYVPALDSAWDRERIDAEVAELRKGTPYESAGRVPSDAGDPAREHVYWRYARGATRYDIEAEGLAGYLDMSKDPEIWRIRRLAGSVRARCERLLRTRAERDAFALAFVTGAVGIDNADGEPAKNLARLLEAKASHSAVRGRHVTDEDVLAAADALDASCGFGAGDTATDVGGVVWLFSGALTEEEKKV